MIINLNQSRLAGYSIITIVVFFFSAIILQSLQNYKRQSVLDSASVLTQSLASAVNPDRIQSLSGTEDDYSDPDFIRLRQQLLKVGPVLGHQGIRWVYLTRRLDDGRHIFLVDSIPDDDPNVAYPGEEYPDYPPEFNSVYTTGIATISAPYQDKWGEFVSILTPITDPSTGSIIAILTADIDQSLIVEQLRPITLAVTSFAFLVWAILTLLFTTVYFRLRHTAEIREIDHRLNLITESVMDAIVMFDDRELVVFWNTAAEKMFGLSPQDAIGRKLSSLIMPSNDSAISTTATPIVALIGQHHLYSPDDRYIEFEAINATTNGRLSIEMSTTSTTFKHQKLTLAVLRDISTRKRAEEQIKAEATEADQSRQALMNVLEDVEEEKARTESLLSGIADGVIAVDSDYKIIYVNDSAVTMLMLNDISPVGQEFNTIVVSQDTNYQPIPEDSRPFYQAISSGNKIVTSVSSPHYYLRRDGTKFPVAITVSPIKIDGIVVGAINVFRDISHEIEVDRMKTEFISLASHQLRTPLSAMKWYSEMLLAGDAGSLSQEQISFVDNIYRSNERMISLVNSLLNISRIESGRVTIDPHPTDIKLLLDDVIHDLRHSFDQKKQSVTVSVHQNLGPIMIDQKMISEVYRNLLTNASKYTPDEGDIEIAISRRDNNIISMISDNGYGIPIKDQPTIFEKFHRGENILKLETDGTGLGLYLVKAIVDSSGGKIWFESQENKGTTFWFSLPITGVVSKKGEVSLNA